MFPEPLRCFLHPIDFSLEVEELVFGAAGVELDTEGNKLAVLDIHPFDLLSFLLRYVHGRQDDRRLPVL